MRRLASLLRSIANTLWCFCGRLWSHTLARSPGQGLVEYGLILVLIMIVCVAILTLTGKNISELWYQKVIQGW